MTRSVHAPLRALALICLTSAGWSFSFGLGAPLASLWLDAAGCAKNVIGWNTGTYYCGMALAALAVPWLMRRRAKTCVMLGMLLSGLTVAAFPWGAGLAWWFGTRLLNGVAGAMSLIPLETYINRDSPPNHRARNFGLYAVAITLGWALGNWLGLHLSHHAPQLAFAIGGAAAAGSGLLVWWRLPHPRAVPPPAAHPGSVRFGENLLSFGSAWNQGFLEGGMIAFLSLYLLSLGLSDDQVGWLTSATMVGVLVFQIPVAWLADRFGRVPVLVACYAVVVVALVALPLCTPSVWLVVWLLLVGACSGAFYPLGLALLGERVAETVLDRANAWYLAIECLGCLVGPVLMGYAVDWSGLKAMFPVALWMVVGFMVLWAATRLVVWLRGAPAGVAPAQDGGSDRRAA
jgi:MFS family permease